MADGPLDVLLVEDSPAHAGLIKEVLAGPPGRLAAPTAFRVTHVPHLAAALARLDQAGADVALLDLSLPDSEGLETVRCLQSHAPELPIVVLTALDDEALAAQAVREGAQDYLVKGELPLELLTRALRYAIERKQAATTLLREQAARVAAEEALRHARRADRQRRQRQRRELRSLEELAAPPATAVTAQVFGVEPLSRAVPETFATLVERYGALLDLALEQRTYKVEHRLSDALRALADELGFLHAGPRDVVELHTRALKARIAAAPSKAQAYIDEARVMVLEAMGHLGAYYRA